MVEEEHRITFDPPERTDTKKVDQGGQIYIGKDLAGEQVRYAIEIVDDEESED